MCHLVSGQEPGRYARVVSRAAIATVAIGIIGFATGFVYGYKVALPPEDPEVRRWWWHKMVEWQGSGS